jgi:hypothetical protein
MAPSAITSTATLVSSKTSTSLYVEQEKEKVGLAALSCGITLPGIPSYTSLEHQRHAILESMALAFRIFARKGFTEGLAGHISVRDPEDPHAFWTNP